MSQVLQSKRLAKLEEMERLKAELEAIESDPELESPTGTLVEKPKRERTEKQKEAFKRATEIRREKAKARKESRDLAEDENRKETEQKVIAKAIALKKKQIKRVQMLDEFSEDEDEPPPRVARQVKSKPPATPRPAKIDTRIKFV